MQMNFLSKRSFILIFVLVFACFVISGCKSQPKSTNIMVSGTVEATETNVNAETSGKITAMLVDEGAQIKQGAVLARLDSTIQALQVQQAEAALSAAMESSKQIKTGNREQLIAQAKAGVQQVSSLLQGAKETMNNAMDNLKRTNALVSEGAVTAQQQLDAQTRYETSKAQYDAFTAQKRAAQEQLSLLQSGATVETINIADAGVAQARASLAVNKAQLAKCVLYAPTDGVVSTLNFRAGEFVAPGAALCTVADTKDLWINIYVSEKELPRVKLGQRAKISVDAYPGQFFNGQVSYISSKAEFTPKNLQTQEERVNMVFEVKVKILDGKDKLKPGLPADVTISD